MSLMSVGVSFIDRAGEYGLFYFFAICTMSAFMAFYGTSSLLVGALTYYQICYVFTLIADTIVSLFANNMDEDDVDQQEDDDVLRNEDHLIVLFNQPDRHDVHATVVQQHVVESFNKVRQSVFCPLPVEQTIAEIRQFIEHNSDANDVNKHKAIKTLDKMEVTNGYVYNLNARELDILSHVWTRIKNPINQGIDLKNNLVQMMADACNNRMVPVCLQGRTSRVIQALDGDKEQIVRVDQQYHPHLIRQLIPSLIQKYTQLLLRKAGKKYFDRYNGYQDGAKVDHLVMQLRGKVRNNILRHLEGKVSQIQLNKWIDEMIDGIE